eukprot:scaffold169675_cov30-Tisochrysis_lutea.AAC.1
MLHVFDGLLVQPGGLCHAGQHRRTGLPDTRGVPHGINVVLLASGCTLNTGGAIVQSQPTSLMHPAAYSYLMPHTLRHPLSFIPPSPPEMPAPARTLLPLPCPALSCSRH